MLGIEGIRLKPMNHEDEMLERITVLCLVAVLAVGCNCVPGDGTGTGGGTGGSGGGGVSEASCTYAANVTVTDDKLQGGAHWTSGVYTLKGSLDVSQGTLVIDPCTKILVPGSGAITVTNGGALSTSGAGGPITFTSANGSPLPGDWNGITFYSSGNNGANKFENVVVEYGGRVNNGSVYVASGARLAMTNSTVRHSADFGIEVDSGGHLASFTGNTLVQNKLGPISIDANTVDELGPGTYTPNTVDAINVPDQTIAHDSRWANHGVPYLVSTRIYVQTSTGSAVLTVDPGVTLKLNPGAIIAVGDNGGLTLNGTASSHVTITSSKASPGAGDWDRLHFYAGSQASANALHNVDIQYGGAQGYGALEIFPNASVTLDNVTFTASKTCDVTNQSGTVSGNSTFTLCP